MKTILIVDDQKSILLTLESILKKENYIVLSCTNSIDAFDKFVNENIDLIITDAIMPMGTNGYTLIASIRNYKKNNQVPIIMLTGKREPTDIEKALVVGANDYMVKPIDPDILLSKVRSLFLKFNKTIEQEFIHAPVNLPVNVITKSSIKSISEVQIKLSTNFSCVIGQIYKIESDFFKQFELPFVSIRILENKPVDNEFEVTGQYISLTEKELSSIRTWIRSKLIQKNS